jgi:hypothetical protein
MMHRRNNLLSFSFYLIDRYFQFVGYYCSSKKIFFQFY